MLIQRYTNPASVIAEDVALINSATKTIDYAAYSLNDPEVINALVLRARAGVAIRLYHDKTELEAMARGDLMVSHAPFHALLGVANLSILVKHSSVLMHLKSYLVDGLMLRDGSANFSPAGEEEQDNSMLVTDDPAAIALFAAKFEQMWARADNQTVQQAIAASPQRTYTPAHRR